MKDNDLRGLVLQKYYEKRREGWIQWKSEDFTDVEEDFSADDLFSVCDQLGQHGLIEWKSVQDNVGKTLDGRGKITADGVDVIERTQRAPLAINLDYSQHNVTVTESSNVQIGSGHVQKISIHIQNIADAIDKSSATDAQKTEAKSAFREFLAHPAVTAILGGLAGTVR